MQDCHPFTSIIIQTYRDMKHKLLLLLLIVGLLPTGCIYDDLSDCDNVIIYFQYKADKDKDVLNQYMDQVDLYVFDENNHIMGIGHYNKDQLASYSAIPSFKLKPGRYNVVALGNAKEYTEVVNVTTQDFDKIYFQHPNWKRDGNVDNHDDNYLGQKTIEITDTRVKLRDTVELFSSHIDVSVEIHGLPVPSGTKSGEIPYELSFENSNAQTNFNNRINLQEKGTCYPELVYDSDKKCIRTDDFALFRMDNNGTLDKEHCSHILVLKNKETGEELVRKDIYEYVTENAKIMDITKQEALLPISIEFKSIGVTIEVPGWAIEEIKPEF